MRRPNVVFLFAFLFATTQSAAQQNQTNPHLALIDHTNRSENSTFPPPENSSKTTAGTSENITENATDLKLLNYSANHMGFGETPRVLEEEENEVDRSLGTVDELTSTDHASINIPSSSEPEQTSDPHNFSTEPPTPTHTQHNATDANPRDVRFKSGISQDADLIRNNLYPLEAYNETVPNFNHNETPSDFGYQYSERTTGESYSTIGFESGLNVLADVTAVTEISDSNDVENITGLRSSSDRDIKDFPTGTTDLISEATPSENVTNDTSVIVSASKEGDDSVEASDNLFDVPQNDDPHSERSLSLDDRGKPDAGGQDKPAGQVQNVVKSSLNRSSVDLLYEISLNRTRGSSGGAKHFGTVLKRPEDRNNHHASGLFANRGHSEPRDDDVKDGHVKVGGAVAPSENFDASLAKGVADLGGGFPGRGEFPVRVTSESWEDVDKDVVKPEKGGESEGKATESNVFGKESAMEQEKSVLAVNKSDVRGSNTHAEVDKSLKEREKSVSTVPKSDNRLETDTERVVNVSKSANEQEKRVATVANMENRAETELKRANSTDKKVAMDDGDHIPWPVKREAVMEGDLVLGGLMMVHEREDTVTCGPVMPQGGVQAVETMLYTLDVINARGILPGVRLGAHVLDDCDKDTYGLEMAVDFIKARGDQASGAPLKTLASDAGQPPSELPVITDADVAVAVAGKDLSTTDAATAAVKSSSASRTPNARSVRGVLPQDYLEDMYERIDKKNSELLKANDDKVVIKIISEDTKDIKVDEDAVDDEVVTDSQSGHSKVTVVKDDTTKSAPAVKTKAKPKHKLLRH